MESVIVTSFNSRTRFGLFFGVGLIAEVMASCGAYASSENEAPATTSMLSDKTSLTGQHRTRDQTWQAFANFAPALVKSGLGFQLGINGNPSLAFDAFYFSTYSSRRDRNTLFDLTGREALWINAGMRTRYFLGSTFYTQAGWSYFESGDPKWITYRRTAIDFAIGNEIVDFNGFSCAIDWFGYSHKLRGRLNFSDEYRHFQIQNGEILNGEYLAQEVSELEDLLTKSPFTFFTFKFGWSF